VWSIHGRAGENQNRTKTCPIDVTWTGSLLIMNNAMSIACFVKSPILDGVVPNLGDILLTFWGIASDRNKDLCRILSAIYKHLKIAAM
jgi:hypothetical protein